MGTSLAAAALVLTACGAQGGTYDSHNMNEGYEIAGTVIDADGNPPPLCTVSAEKILGTDLPEVAQIVTPGQSFSAGRSVGPGVYRFHAHCDDLTGTLTVTVTNANVEGLELVVFPPGVNFSEEILSVP